MSSNKHPLRKKEKYFIFVDDIILSTQFMLYKSLVVFSKKMVDNRNIINNEDYDKQLRIPHSKNNSFDKMIRDYSRGNSEELNNVLKKCEKLLNEKSNELGIEKPEDTTTKILTRKKKEVLTVNDLLDIHEEFPVLFQPITSRFGSSIPTMEDIFQDTHVIVFNDKLTEVTYKKVFFNGEEDFNRFKLDCIQKDELFDELDKLLDKDKKINVTTTEKDVIEKIVEDRENIENIFINLPTTCNYVSREIIPRSQLVLVDLW